MLRLGEEYGAVGKREAERLGIPASTVDVIVTAFCFAGRETSVHFRVRPFLADHGDEFLLELAVAGAADAIVTHNIRHFAGVEQFGIRALTPRDFLRNYIESRARLFRREDFERALEETPDVEPDVRDRL